MKNALLLLLIVLSSSFIQAQRLNVTVLTTNESCVPGSDGTATVAVSGGMVPYTYLWSNANVTQTLSGLTAGTYIVTVTDANGRTQTGVGIVSSPPPITVNHLITPPSCPGLSDGSITTTISGGTNPFTYVWSGGIGGASPTNVAAGSYSLSVTDGLGCSGLVIIIVPDPPAIDTSISQNGSILTANQANASYQWLDCNGGNNPIPGATSQSYMVSVSGSYAVDVTLNACTSRSQCINMTISDVGEIPKEKEQPSIYPNPTDGEFRLSIPQDQLGERIQIFNLQGKVIHEASLSSQQENIDLSEHAAGIYFLKLGTTTRKLVIK